MHLEERVRTQLRRQHKLVNRTQAYQQFSGQTINGRDTAFKLPTTEPWRTVHALVCRTLERRLRENRMHGLKREGWLL